MPAPLTRDALLALPPVLTLAQLGQAFGYSEPTVREAFRRGDIEASGIGVVRWGQHYRFTKESVLQVLGIRPADGATSEEAPRSAAGGPRPIGEGVRQGRRLRAAGNGDGP